MSVDSRFNSANVANVYGATSTFIYAASATDLYLVFSGEFATPGVNVDLCLMKSTDGGNTWTGPTVIDSIAKFGYFAFASVYVTGSNIYVSYQKYPLSGPAIWAAKSTDGGSTWSTNQVASSGGDGHTMFSNGTEIFIVYPNWDAGSVHAVVSDDGASTWSTYTIDANPIYPSNTYICGAGSNLFVVYDSYDDKAIKFARSADCGQTWSTSFAVTSLTSTDAPCIGTLDGNTLFVSYRERVVSPLYDVKFIKSTDGGATWGIPITIDQSRAGSLTYSIFVANNSDILITRGNQPNAPFADNNYLVLHQSSSGGDTWSSTNLAEDNALIKAGSYSSIAATAPNKIYVVHPAKMTVNFSTGNGPFVLTSNTSITGALIGPTAFTCMSAVQGESLSGGTVSGESLESGLVRGEN